MRHDENVQVVLVTAPGGSPAENLAAQLVDERLAACVNRIQGVQSVYRWQGEVTRDTEDLLLIKTTRSLFPRLRERILELHPYEVPEVLALEVADGSDRYVAWVREQVGG